MSCLAQSLIFSCGARRVVGRAEHVSSFALLYTSHHFIVCAAEHNSQTEFDTSYLYSICCSLNSSTPLTHSYPEGSDFHSKAKYSVVSIASTA